MQEVAYPDADGEKQVERQVLDASQREHSLPDAAQRGFHLIIYRKLVQQQVQQQEGGNTTGNCHEPARQRETAQDVVHRSACLAEESSEDAHLEEQDKSRVEHHRQRIDGPFRDHCA